MTGTPIASLREDYLTALLAGDATRARSLVDRAVATGVPVADVYLEVLDPAMREIGERWAAGEVGIAYEHYASAVTQGIVGSLGPKMRVPPMSGRLAVLTCTPGERHCLGVQMVADFLEGAGWEVLQLGTSLPAGALVELVESEQPDAVGLSTTTPDRLDGAEEALTALRAVEPAPYVVVGGQAWSNGEREKARSLGADACHSDPLAFVRELTERFPPVTDEPVDPDDLGLSDGRPD